jgi:hypothetical protein
MNYSDVGVRESRGPLGELRLGIEFAQPVEPNLLFWRAKTVAALTSSLLDVQPECGNNDREFSPLKLSFAYSVSACLRIGMSGSAFFQSCRNSW